MIRHPQRYNHRYTKELIKYIKNRQETYGNSAYSRLQIYIIKSLNIAKNPKKSKKSKNLKYDNLKFQTLEI